MRDMETKIVYFGRSGPVNTNKTLKIARDRAKQLGIKDVVIASSHGSTALKAAKVFKGMEVNLIAVTISAGFEKEGWTMTPRERKRLEEEGIKVLTCAHTLGDGVAVSFVEEQGGISMEQIVAQTLYRFCQGMKVCVEIILMAADAGLIDTNHEVIAIAGTGEGADTAIVAKPSYSRKFSKLDIMEILAKPRKP